MARATFSKDAKDAKDTGSGAWQAFLTLAEEAGLTVDDNKAVHKLLLEKGDDALYIGPVVKMPTKKGSKPKKAVLVIGKLRIYTLKKAVLEKQGHHLELTTIRSHEPSELQLTFTTFSIDLRSNEADIFITAIRQGFLQNFSGMPDRMRPKLDIQPPSRIKSISSSFVWDMINGFHVLKFDKPCGGFVGTYKAVADFLGVAARDDICWEINNLYEGNRNTDFNFRDFEPFPTPVQQAPLLLSLRYSTYFTTLRLEHFKLDAACFAALLDLLKDNPVLQHLALIEVPMPSFSQVCDNLRENPHVRLKSLTLIGNAIDEKGAGALAVLLENQECCARLEKLVVSRQAFLSKGSQLILQGLIKNSRLPLSLLELSLEGLKLEKASQQLANFLTQSNAIRVLNLVNTAPIIELILPSLSGCKDLESLDLSYNKLVSKAGVCAIENWLRAPSFKTIKRLVVVGCALSAELLKGIFANCGHPFDLDARENALTANAARLLGSIPETQMTAIDLSDNDLGDEAISAMCQALSNNAKKLQRLSLNHNFRVRSKMRVTAIESIINLVSSNYSLASLSLTGNRSSFLTPDELCNILTALVDNRSLAELDISGHRSGTQGAIYVARVLHANQTLSKLRWDENATTLEGFEKINGALLRNRSLRDMPLPINDLTAALTTERAPERKEKLEALASSIQSYIIRNAIGSSGADTAATAALERLLLSEIEVPITLIYTCMNMPDADQVAKALVILFEANSQSNRLLQEANGREVNGQEYGYNCFCRSSMASHMVTFHARMVGSSYLTKVLQAQLQEIVSKNLGFPADLNALSGTELQQSQALLQQRTQQLVDSLFASSAICPAAIRTSLHHVHTAMMHRFPADALQGVGVCFLERFVAPAVAYPDAFSILNESPPLHVRRLLASMALVLVVLARGGSFMDHDPNYKRINESVLEPLRAPASTFFRKLAFAHDEEGNAETRSQRSASGSASDGGRSGSMSGSGEGEMFVPMPPPMPQADAFKLPADVKDLSMAFLNNQLQLHHAAMNSYLTTFDSSLAARLHAALRPTMEIKSVASPPQKMAPVFAQTVESVMYRPSNLECDVPDLVSCCISWLSAPEHLKLEGLFRLSGKVTRIEELRRQVDSGLPVATLLPRHEDPHVVAGLLKLWLRELPEPLVPEMLYSSFTELRTKLDGQEDKLNHSYQLLLHRFPRPNRAILKLLLELLYKVSKFSETNKMSPSNLAIVFAPTLLRTAGNAMESAINDSAVCNQCVEWLIKHQAVICGFPSGI